MADFRFTRKTYDELCNLCRVRDAYGFKAIVDAVSDEEKSRFGPTTFSPPLPTGLPSPLIAVAIRRLSNTSLKRFPMP